MEVVNSDIQAISELIKRDPEMTFKSRYVNRFGQFVPRVTEILSFDGSSTEGLLRWANNLGFKGIRYTDSRNMSATIGTNGHNAIEGFLKGTITDSTNMVVRAFQQWYMMIIKSHTFEVLSMEQTLVCDWFGGTYDLLCKIDGKVFLVDFKTSNYITYKYFMQLAAYRYMLELNGIRIDGCIILQLSKESPEFNEYYLDFSNKTDLMYITDCTYAFFALVNAYYATMKVSIYYKKIFEDLEFIGGKADGE